MLGKKTIKTYMIVLLAVITILFCCGAQSNVSVNFSYDMKSNVVLTVESELSESDFSAAIQKNIDGINLVSGDDDILKLNKITETDGGYEVSVKLRRIDKVKALGEFFYSDINKFLIEGGERRRLIENWSNGVWRYSGSAVISGERGHVDITRDHDGKQEVFPQTANGEKVAFDKFVSDNLENKNLKLFSFFMPALDRTIGEVTSLTFRIDGKIVYYAGNGIEKIGYDTVKLTPKIIKADVTQKDMTPTWGKFHADYAQGAIMDLSAYNGYSKIYFEMTFAEDNTYLTLTDGTKTGWATDGAPDNAILICPDHIEKVWGHMEYSYISFDSLKIKDGEGNYIDYSKGYAFKAGVTYSVEYDITNGRYLSLWTANNATHGIFWTATQYYANALEHITVSNVKGLFTADSAN